MRQAPTTRSLLLLLLLPGLLLGLAGDSPAQAPQAPAHAVPAPDRILAHTLTLVVDDFLVDVYHNGVRLPDARRELVADVFGATVERIKVDVRPGDWLVFNVVNNRLRWGGASYFAVSARGDSGTAFTTELASGRWSCCDDPGQVGQFIAEADRFRDHRALPIAAPWEQGDSLMAQHADGWAGKPIWGDSRNTWIKYVAR